MKASELRIGNFIYINGVANQLSEIHQNSFKFKGNNTLWNEKQCKPIPLTEEWLLKFGFEECFRTKQGILKQYRKSNIKFDISNSGNVYYSHKNIPMYSVHQLQNLYFALTGEELNIKGK